MHFKKSIFSFLLGLNLIQANAYVAEHLQEGEEGSPQIVTAILFSEDGEPRCKIVSQKNRFLFSEHLNDFIEYDAEVEQVIDELRNLRECDEGDELYANIVLNPEGIQLAGIPSPGKKMILVALGFTVTRLSSFLALPA